MDFNIVRIYVLSLYFSQLEFNIKMNSYASISDSELTVQLKNSDEAAFAELYNRYWRVLYIHAYRMINDKDQASDIVQDIFTILWKTRTNSSINSSVKSYLYKAVRNQVLNNLYRGKLKNAYLKSLASFAENAYSHIEEDAEFRDFAKRIDQEVEKFPPQMKLIFGLSRKEGFSNKEIARDLNITDHTVKKTINRALHRLKTQISFFLFF